LNFRGSIESRELPSTSDNEDTCRVRFLKKKKKARASVHMCNVDDCLSFLNTEEELQIHMETHKTGELYVCKIDSCGKTFLSDDNLIRHKKTHFPIRKLYKCDFPGCTKSFTASYNQKVKPPAITL
jgi:hypothetical protein